MFVLPDAVVMEHDRLRPSRIAEVQFRLGSTNLPLSGKLFRENLTAAIRYSELNRRFGHRPGSPASVH